MRYATKESEIKEIENYMKLSAEEAKKSTCKKSQRGAINPERILRIHAGGSKYSLGL